MKHENRAVGKELEVGSITLPTVREISRYLARFRRRESHQMIKDVRFKFRRKSAMFGLILTALTTTANDVEARHTGGVRTQTIDMIVIHSTGGPTCDAVTDKPIWVSAGTLDENLRQIEAHPKLGIHYMIDRDGTVRSSVPEEQIAHHVMHYSQRSIAIELINEGDGRDPFPEAQLASLVKLLRDIRQRRGITRDGIKRHSDLDHALLPCDKTQRRKVDPGAAFPYKTILDRVYQH